MILVKVKQIRVVGAGPRGMDELRPELPQSLERSFGWSQASNCFEKQGFVLVFLPTATPQEIADIQKQEGAEILKVIDTPEKGEQLVASTKEPFTDFKNPAKRQEFEKHIQDKRTAFLEAYRPHAKEIEDSLLSASIDIK